MCGRFLRLQGFPCRRLKLNRPKTTRNGAAKRRKRAESRRQGLIAVFWAALAAALPQWPENTRRSGKATVLRSQASPFRWKEAFGSAVLSFVP